MTGQDQNTLSMPLTSVCGKVATGRGIRQADTVQSAAKARATILLPGLRVPSLNELLRMHYGQRCALSNRYRRLLASCASRLREDIEERRSTEIILWEVSNSCGTKSQAYSDGMMQNISVSNGATNKRKGRYAKWKSKRW